MMSAIYSALLLFSLLGYLTIYEPNLNEGLFLAVIIVFGMLFGHFDGRDVEKRKGKSK